MAATAPNEELRAPAVPERATPLETLRIWTLHLACFVLPVTTLAFLLTAPHRWWTALPWLGVIVGSVLLDKRSAPELRQPALRLARWPFDAVLYVLAANQLLCVGLAAWTRFATRLLARRHAGDAADRRRQLGLLAASSSRTS